MTSMHIDDSDEFDDDSLNKCSDKDSLENLSDIDIDEIPESPIAAASNSNSNKNGIESTDKLSKFKNSLIKPLPIVQLRKDQISNENVLDFRGIKRDFTNTPSSFGKMKFKDFKQALKAMKQGSQESSLASELTSSRMKKAKVDTNKFHHSKPDKDFVNQNMFKVKESIDMMNQCVNKMQTKQVVRPKADFIKTRKSIFPEQVDVIVNETIESNDSNNMPSDASDCDEIPDSLEVSENEIAESDLEDYQNELGPSASGHEFIKSRPTIVPTNAPIYVDETIIEETNINSSKNSDNDSLCSVVDETVNFPLVKDDSSAESLEVADSFDSRDMFTKSNDKSTKMKTHPKESGVSKLRLYKKVKTSDSERDFASEYNHEVGNKNGRNANSKEGKMLHSPVRKKKERKELLGFICKQCQDYYSNRDLTDEQIDKLIQKCSRHRAKHSPYRSPTKFWDTDFTSSSEIAASSNAKNKLTSIKGKETTSKRVVPKSAQKLELDRYSRWEADIVSKSRESNVLNSTKLQ